MRITVYNTKRKNHTICKTNGQRLVIYPCSSVDIITDDDREIKYWTGLSEEVLNGYGLSVSFDDEESDSVSIADGFVSPYAKQIAEQYNLPSEDESNKPLIESNDTGFYSEDELMQMDREDLYNLCNNFNIKYRKNASVKTLVALIMERTRG